ncbi:MAG: hypothetical protein V9F03_04515 [Microthrixaceae bacterium]
MGLVTATAVILAHQGGWDEFLMVAAPVVIFAVLLRTANRRASHLGDDEGAAFRSDHNKESDQPHGLI